MNQEQLNAIKEEYSNMNWEDFRENAGDLLTDEIDIYNTVVIEGVPALITEVERLMKGMHQLREYISLTKHSDDLENINGILWSIMQGGEADE